MFRFVSLSIVGLLAFGGSAFADAPCAYYDGHMDVETRIGNRRDIGEASLFLPLSCSEDTLLFSDMRFKLDDSRNREGNLALGIRHMRETGIVGAYAYFDRKRSGVTGKYTIRRRQVRNGWRKAGKFAAIFISRCRARNPCRRKIHPFPAPFWRTQAFILKKKPRAC